MENKKVETLITELYKKIESNFINKNILSENFKTNFKKIDDLFPIYKNELIIIGSRPGMGKTAFLLDLFNRFIENYKCMFFLLMTKKKH